MHRPCRPRQLMLDQEAAEDLGARCPRIQTGPACPCYDLCPDIARSVTTPSRGHLAARRWPFSGGMSLAHRPGDALPPSAYSGAEATPPNQLKPCKR